MTDISAIRAREQAATPGPWMIKIHNEQYGQGYGEITYFVDIEGELLKIGLADNNRLFAKYHSDTDFIAHAREDIPYLLDRLEQAEAEVERLREALEIAQQGYVDCMSAERQTNGACLGYGRSDCDDEPCEQCRECPQNSAYEQEKTISEWAALDGIKVYDPDGFDRTDPLLWERKITKAEYDAGIMRCTVMPLPAPPEEGERNGN